MLGEKIKALRIEKGMTQKDLADKLFVTAQAVSRWENGEVEPSISTVVEMAKIFGVSGDLLLGVEGSTQQTEVKVEEKFVYQEPVKPVLGVCETCNKPIFEANDLVRKTFGGRHQSTHLYCFSCERKRQESEKMEKINRSRTNRIKAYVWGGIAAGIVLAITIFSAIDANDFSSVLFYSVIAVAIFTFISCCFLNNNFIGGLTIDIFQFGFVRMPGLIFGLDLDGIIWFLTVKLVLFILGIVLAIAFGILGLLIGGALSIVVYPFALYKSYKHPELTD
jgi:transcriptional regulator with XRE-family HTH domain